MPSEFLTHELLFRAVEAHGHRGAITFGPRTVTYEHATDLTRRVAAGLMDFGILAGDRVGIFSEKRIEAVAAMFGAMAAGAVMVPINPVLKGPQVSHIARDCGIKVLITSSSRYEQLVPHLIEAHELRHVVLLDGSDAALTGGSRTSQTWDALLGSPERDGHRRIETDVAAILYTSGSTGRPKGVVLSHRNLVAGACSVSGYLENHPDDVLLAALPLSFDAGFSQLTTAFHVGARVVLLNHVVPRDIVVAMASEGVTGITGVPPLFVQLAGIPWPEAASEKLRYFANTGGKMPQETLRRLRVLAPSAKPFLMFGLTEAFRATYLAPEEVDRRPDSIGKAIPNADIMVLRPDGSPCDANEPGELVQRGPHVALGYWNDPEKTSERFKVLPRDAGGRPHAVMLEEVAVFSGDIVQRDDEGFFYFVGRRDEMIKSSGYRVSPTEIEEALYSSQLVTECAVFGIPDHALGERIVAAVLLTQDHMPLSMLEHAAKRALPGFMVPSEYWVHTTALPKGPNGKLDRRALANAFSLRPADSHV